MLASYAFYPDAQGLCSVKLNLGTLHTWSDSCNDWWHLISSPLGHVCQPQFNLFLHLLLHFLCLKRVLGSVIKSSHLWCKQLCIASSNPYVPCLRTKLDKIRFDCHEKYWCWTAENENRLTDPCGEGYTTSQVGHCQCVWWLKQTRMIC